MSKIYIQSVFLVVYSLLLLTTRVCGKVPKMELQGHILQGATPNFKVHVDVIPKQTEGKGQKLEVVSKAVINRQKIFKPITLSILQGISTQTFTEAVNMQTGKVNFQLHLVPEIGLEVHYSGASEPTLGNDASGWTIPHQNYIIMDPHSNTLESEAKHFLVLDGKVLPLEVSKSDGTSDKESIQSYTVVGHNDTSIQVVYFVEKWKWVVETKSSTLTFGLNERAVKWVWAFRSWKETPTETRIKIPIQWFLSRFVRKSWLQEESEQPKLVLLYDYNQIMKTTDDKDETKRLQYPDVFQLISVVSEDAEDIRIDLQFHSEDHQLISYDAKVKNIQQSVKFLYNDNRFLEEIQESMESRWETAVKFNYDLETLQISQVSIPKRMLEVTFQYEVLQDLVPEGIKSITLEGVQESMLSAVHGSSISVFAYSNHDLVAFNTANGRFDEIGKLSDGAAKLSTKPQTVAMIGNTVIRLTTNTPTSIITVFVFDPISNPQWKVSKSESYPEMLEVKLTKLGDVVTLNKDGILEINSWDYQTSEFSSVHTMDINETTTPDWFHVTDTKILWYYETADELNWILKGHEGWSNQSMKYHSKTSKMDCGTLFLNSFDLGPTSDAKIKSFMNSIKFQILQNEIAVMGCSIEDDSKIMIHVDIISTDEKGYPALTKDFEISVEDIAELKHSISGNNIRYVKEGEVFRFEISNPKAPSQTVLLTQAFRNREQKKSERSFLFELNKYKGFFISNSAFQIGSSDIIEHNGDEWVHNNQSQVDKHFELNLGRHFILAKTGNEDRIQLLHGAEVIDTFGTELSDVGQNYPGYIAWSSNNITRVWLFTRDLNGTEGATLLDLRNQWIVRDCSSAAFLVTRLTNSTNMYRILLAGWQGQVETTAVSMLDIKGDELDRVIAYEYKKARLTKSRQLTFGETFLIKGGNKTENGYISFSSDIGATNPKVFNGDGVSIEEIRSNDGTPNDCNWYENSKVYDKWGIRQITTLSPYKKEDCQVGFIGFEDYEEAQLASENCPVWTYNSSNVVRTGLALTGNNYLVMQGSNNGLSKTFPLLLKTSYTISAWVRINENGKENLPTKATSILHAEITAAEQIFFSRILFSRGDWKYLQIKMDFNEIHVSDTGDSPLIEIMIRGVRNGTVDVDHVIFSPHTWNSEVFVYNEQNAVTHNLLGNTGFIVSKVYDDFGVAVCKTNGLGQVPGIQFETTGDGTETLRSLIALQSWAETGWIQGFQNDPLVNFSPEPSNIIKVFSNGFLYSDFTIETNLTLRHPETNAGVGLRFTYSFLSNNPKGSVVRILIAGHEYNLTSDGKGTLLASSSSQERSLIPTSGSILIVFIHPTRILLWTQKGLLFEDEVHDNSNSRNLIRFHLRGRFVIENVVIIPSPSVSVKYMNALGDDVQLIKIHNDTSIVVVERIYDGLGRPHAITKETQIKVGPLETLLKFRPDFITEFDHNGQSLIGEVNNLNPDDKGSPFASIAYKNEPLDGRKSEGRPGPQYKISGSLEIKYTTKSPDTTISKLFPEKDGYKYKVKTIRVGYTETIIMDHIGDYN